MKFGIGLFTGQRRNDDRWSDVYDDMVTLATEAESFGFDSVWVSEHHFAPDGYMPGLLPTLGAFAAATDEIEIGTAMLLAPLHDAIQIAEDAATVSLLSSGRVTLGLANGYCEREFEVFGIDKHDRPRRTEETIKIARGAWSNGPLGFDPQTHSASADVNVTPKPDEPPRIVLGGTSKPAVRRAALLADGWNAPELISVEDVAKRVRYQRRLRDVEHIDGEFTVYAQQYCFVGESKRDAWERVRDPLFYIHRVYQEMETGEPVERLSVEHRNLVRRRAIFGSPADVLEQIETYRDAIGDDLHMILRTYYPGMDLDVMRKCNKLLVDKVVPELR